MKYIKTIFRNLEKLIAMKIPADLVSKRKTSHYLKTMHDIKCKIPGKANKANRNPD